MGELKKLNEKCEEGYAQDESYQHLLVAARVRIGDEQRGVGGGCKNIDISESDGAQMRLFSFVHETFAGNTYFIYLVIFFFFWTLL